MAGLHFRARHPAVVTLALAWLSSVNLVPIVASAAQKYAPGLQQAPDPGGVTVTLTVLEGAMRLSGVDVELRSVSDNTLLARAVSDGAGQVTFPEAPPGQYVVHAERPGFVTASSPPFHVRPGETAQVLLDLQLIFVAPSVQVRVPSSPTQSVQPVSSSDMLSGSALDVAPLQGDNFQSLLPLLPGVVRGPDGRLRAKGGQATQSALQISSASLADPSSGDFDLELPGQSLESVEVLANPYAAEYGRFSSAVVQLRTKPATNEWEIKPGNMMPRFRKHFTSVRGFEPRFSVRGPLRRDRLFLAQDFQFRNVNDPVKSLPDEPDIRLRSFDSFTRVDGIFSPRHAVIGMVVLFPREIEHLTMNTFRPPGATPDFNQNGIAAGAQDRLAISTMMIESTVAVRSFEIDVNGSARESMTYAPQSQHGSFFNDQERQVRSLQWIEALSISTDRGYGAHAFKFGLDLQDARYDSTSVSRPVEIRRLDGSLAERIVAAGPRAQEVSALEFALFAQDRWRLGSRLTIELGLRMDREDVIERVNWSPRAGVAVGLLPEGRGILRGGLGRFRQRTPLNVGAFDQFESREVTRFGVDGEPLGPTVRFVNVPSPDLRTPEAVAGNVEWNQRFGRRVLFKANYLQRRGSHEYIVEPVPVTGELRLVSEGRSRYRELEVTGRYLGGEQRDLTVSYVRSHGTADVNNYDQFYGNIRNPIVRANENTLIPTDVPHRLIVRGTLGLPASWEIAPVIEVRSGFPWSAVDEFQDFVGPRNRAGRFPAVRTLDFSLYRPWRLRKYRFRAGIKVYNLFGATADRDVQGNVTSQDYGRFFNPVERSIGFVFGTQM